MIRTPDSSNMELIFQKNGLSEVQKVVATYVSHGRDRAVAYELEDGGVVLIRNSASRVLDSEE